MSIKHRPERQHGNVGDVFVCLVGLGIFVLFCRAVYALATGQ